MARFQRSFVASVAASVLSFVAAAAPAAEQAVEVLARRADGAPVPGAHVALAAEKGAAFTAEGATDDQGRFETTLPDTKRSYRLHVTKEGLVDFDQSVDLSKQRPRNRGVLTLEVTLPPLAATDWFNRGVAAIRSNDLVAAAAALDRAVETDPTFVRGWGVRALVAAEANQWDVALSAAEHAIALAPQDAQALRTRYDALLRLGRRDDAASALDALVAEVHDGEVARLAFNAGAAAANHGQVDEARKRFAQTLELAPELWQAHSALAELEIRDKSYEPALAELDRALAGSPGNVSLLKRKVDVLEALGDAARLEAARKALAAAEAAAP